jgi:hypothetical protein
MGKLLMIKLAKKITLLIFIFLLTFISTKALFHKGVPVTHDGNNHIVRFANYYIALKEFQFPPRLAPNLVNHYGYPVFNFNYPLANILSVPFTVLGFHYQFTFKFLLFASVFMGLLGAYQFLTEKKFEKKAILFSLFVFALTPYLITSMIFRGNIGEVMAWGIIPWIFYFLEKIKNQKSKEVIDINFLFLTFFLILLFLSHNITALFASGLIIFYLFFVFAKDLFKWKRFIFSFILAFGASLWFWLPALLEKNLTILDDVDLTLNYYKHFPSLKQLLAIPIEFGYSYWGRVDTMTFGLGALQILLLFLSIIYLLKIKNFKKSKENLIFFILLLLTFIFQLPFTKTIYDIVPFVDFIQFPWRLSLLFSIVLLPVSATLYQHLNKNWRKLFFILIILQSLQFLNLKAIDYRDKDKVDYEFFGDTTSVNKENLPKTFTYQGFADWEATAEIKEGQGKVVVDKWRGSQRSYQLNLETDSLIIEPTAYFAGWQTKVKNLDNDGDWENIDYIDNEVIQGRIAYQLEAGNYQVKTRFTQKTWPRIIGNSVSALSLTIFSFLFFKWRKDIKKSKKT